jgi:pimeloyl-ACP methyl ester carboxylesterase
MLPSRRTGLTIAAIILGGLGAASYPSYRRDVDRAYHRIRTGSQIAQTRCGPLEYAVAGEGPPVLVVHGAGGGFDQGLELGGSLARGGFRVIAVSRFGYLGTPLPADASAAAQADAHAYVLPVRPRRPGLVNDAAVLSAQPRCELEKITAPTLAISTTDDLYGTFEGARYTAEHVRHARFIGYPSGGHMLVERSAETATEICRFLEESGRVSSHPDL